MQMLPSPLTGFEVQAEVVSPNFEPLVTVYREDSIGKWGLECKLYTAGFGRLLPTLNRPGLQLDTKNLREVLALATSKVWRENFTNKKGIFIVTKEFLVAGQPSGFKEKWPGFRFLTPEMLWDEVKGLKTVLKATQTLWNLVEAEETKGEGVLLPERHANTFDVPNDPFPDFFRESLYPGGVVYGSVQRESRSIIDGLEREGLIMRRCEMLRGIQHTRITITHKGYVQKEEHDDFVVKQRAKEDVTSVAISRSLTAEQLIGQGPKAFREHVLRGFERASGNSTRSIIQFRDLAKELELEEMEVGHALEYWVNEGLAVRMTVSGFSLSHRGLKELEMREEQAIQLNSGVSKDEKSNLGRSVVLQEDKSGLVSLIQALGPKPPPPGVFIGHGRSNLFFEVESHIATEFGVHPQTFERLKVAGGQVIPTLERLLDECGFAVIVATAEDEADDKMRARQNVVHEIGLFQGRHGFDRVAVLMQEGIEKFTNLDGLLVITFDGKNVKHAFADLDKALRNGGYKHS